MFKTFKSIWQGLTQKGKIFPHQLAFTLLISLRNWALSPQQIVQRRTTAFWKWAAGRVISARHWRSQFRKDDWWRRIYSRKCWWRILKNNYIARTLKTNINLSQP